MSWDQALFCTDNMSRQLPYKRAERVAGEIYHVVAGVVLNDLTDPRLKGVQITTVRMSGDLRIARIYFHLNEGDEEKRRNALKGLASAKGFIKRRIGQHVSLRYMPEIEFFYDERMDEEERVEEILKNLRTN